MRPGAQLDAERKAAGSYYSPPELVEELIDSALLPVIQERLARATEGPAAERALLDLMVCDPACGSGHFLLAAARRLAGDLARLRSPRDELDQEAHRTALADVISHCIYGVDKNPLAVELCRVALWLESGGTRTALGALGRHVKSGDALVGVLDLGVLDGDCMRGQIASAELRPRCDGWTARIMGVGDGQADGAAEHLERAFFHWPIEFPEVFAAGGFDVVLTNPPWDILQPEEVTFFRAQGRQDVAGLPGALRKRAIRELGVDAHLGADWMAHRRAVQQVTSFIRSSGRYPLSGKGRLNSYSAFVELARALLRPCGRAGLIVPSGLATDAATSELFCDLMDSGQLVSLFHFDNRKRLFAAVASSMTFCLVTLRGSGHPDTRGADFAFFLHSADDLRDVSRRVALSREDMALLNPNTRCAPTFGTKRDAELTRAIYRRAPILRRRAPAEHNPWSISFRQGLFNMTADSHLFRTRDRLESDGWRLRGNVFQRDEGRYLPLYEAKMLHQFDHRWADGHSRAGAAPAGERRSPSDVVLPRYWVPSEALAPRLGGRWDRDWLLGCRLVCRSTDSRTVIGTILPRWPCGNSVLTLFPGGGDAQRASGLLACLSSFALDYAARQKLGGINLNFHILEQLPILPPATFEDAASWSLGEPLLEWLSRRVLQLVYTDWALAPFARDQGYDGPPFSWDDQRRFAIRCELDAAFFCLYGMSQQEVDRVMDTFPIVRRRDEAQYAEYRTKRVILAIFGAMVAGHRV